MQQFFIRLGVLGDVFVAKGSAPVRRGRRVIVRSPRGVELGEVLGKRDPAMGVVQDKVFPADGSGEAVRHQILRETTDEDEAIIRRLDRHKKTAVEACRRKLRAAGSDATLLDVDQLFDGGTLIMHFLGHVDAIAESITGQIVKEYERVVRTRHLAKMILDGCGPQCGTQQQCGTDEQADGVQAGRCDPGGCAGCRVASVRRDGARK